MPQPLATTPPGPANRLRLLPLIAATYFMMAGGPYGLEDIVGDAGYGIALLMLAVVPFVWSLPTALMVGELASALPAEGGFYIWVSRALGPFWGFQEAWLSLAASVFDMALYPVTFVLYLGRIAPALTAGPRGVLWALAVVAVCAVWNLRGAGSVGRGAMLLFVVLLAPFAVLIVAAVLHARHAGIAAAAPLPARDLPAALLVALWNNMGWDNASTVAGEVENPQRNYPLAMIGATALVALSYMLPIAAVALTGLPAAQFSTGAWADAARTLGGPALALAIAAGGMVNGVGMFNPLVMSYSRLPPAMAGDGLLPRVFARLNRWHVPWFSVVALSVLWSLALRFTFERLITLDLVLYGSSLVLEFVALTVLRLREPGLPRPFAITGGVAGTVLLALPPCGLIAFALWTARTEHVAGMPALLFALLVACAGAALYWLTRGLRRHAAA